MKLNDHVNAFLSLITQINLKRLTCLLITVKPEFALTLKVNIEGGEGR